MRRWTLTLMVTIGLTVSIENAAAEAQNSQTLAQRLTLNLNVRIWPRFRQPCSRGLRRRCPGSTKPPVSACYGTQAARTLPSSSNLRPIPRQ